MRGSTKFSSWLYQIARMTTIDFYKRKTHPLNWMVQLLILIGVGTLLTTPKSAHALNRATVIKPESVPIAAVPCHCREVEISAVRKYDSHLPYGGSESTKPDQSSPTQASRLFSNAVMTASVAQHPPQMCRGAYSYPYQSLQPRDVPVFRVRSTTFRSIIL